MTTLHTCACCGTPDHDAPMRAAIAARDANGGYDHPTRLWRVRRKNRKSPGGYVMQAHTDGKGWYFYVYTTEASAQKTCDQWNRETSPECAYEPVEINLRGNVPHKAICMFKDGDQWCAVFGDFINLQESLVGFGPTQRDAIDDLDRALQVEKLSLARRLT